MVKKDNVGHECIQRGRENNTHRAHLKKNMKKMSVCFSQNSCYHSDLVSSPVTNSLHFLSKESVQDSITIFSIHIVCQFLYKHLFFYIGYHKEHNFKTNNLKKKIHSKCACHLTRTVTLDLLLCTKSDVWCHLHCRVHMEEPHC